jgi:Tol biopolymer transport system component
MRLSRTVLTFFILLTLTPVAGLSSETQILSNALFPSWSPDGSEIACNMITSFDRAFVVPSGGGIPATLITDAEGPALPHYMPDGDHVVYFRVRSGDTADVYEFVIHDLLGGDPVVWEAPQFWYDERFTLTADGAEVVFTMQEPGEQVWALDLSDGSTRYVTAGKGAAISPDGQWIAYTVSDTMLVVEATGAKFTQELGSGRGPSWLPDNYNLICTGTGDSGTSDLILYSRDGSYRQQLTDDVYQDLWCEVSRDGKSVAYVKTLNIDTGPFYIYVMGVPEVATEPETWGGLKAIFR